MDAINLYEDTLKAKTLAARTDQPWRTTLQALLSIGGCVSAMCVLPINNFITTYLLLMHIIAGQISAYQRNVRDWLYSGRVIRGNQHHASIL